METCILCKSSQKDDVQYGDFLKNDHFGVHTFCLYLSSNLQQRGEDSEGILGFLEQDIRKEVRRVSLLKCCYCNKMYANIGCCIKKCRRTFHLICGIKNGAQNQFSHKFESFCQMHAKIETKRPSANETCLICYERLRTGGKRYLEINTILTPCCRNGWFHKLCLQMSAKTAGYFFKCPLCNDSKIFREKLPAKGIYIPNQDAAWELEPNAFAELLERPNECAAQRCMHSEGRKASSDSNPFVMCSTCGSTAMHKKCLPNSRGQFQCNDCNVAIGGGDSGRDSFNLHVNNNDIETEYIDVCHVSDKEDLEIIKRLTATNNKMEENKRDSGIQQNNNTDSDDEEIFQATRHHNRTRKIRESSEENTSCSKTEYNDHDDNKQQKRKSRTNSISSPLAQHALASRRTKRYTESSKDTLDDDDDDDDFLSIVKNRKMRIRSDTESSKDTLKDENTSRVIRSKKRRIKIGIESSNKDTSSDEDMPQVSRSKKTRQTRIEKECNKNILVQDKTKFPQGSKYKENTLEKKELSFKCIKTGDTKHLKCKSESSEIDELPKPKLKNRNCLRLFDDSGDMSEYHEMENIKNSQLTNTTQSKCKGKGISLSEELQVVPPSKKRKCLSDLSDSENDLSCVQEMHLVNETCQNDNKIDNISHKLTISIDESDSDDPLDNISRYINKHNNLNTCQDLIKEGNGKKICVQQEKERTKQSKFVPLKSPPQKDNKLDVSCIAKRTRRKTLSSNINNLKNDRRNEETPLNILCRTRRKTICAETNYNKETLCETTKVVYKKTHKSDNDDIMLTDDHDNHVLKNTTDLDSFGTDDGYEKKEHNFDISCIANRTRTRKRKSLEANRQHLAKIAEIFDNSSDSSNTLNSSKKYLCRNYNGRLHSNDDKKINEETQQSPKATLSNSNCKIKKIPSVWLDKLPPYNCTAFIRSNVTPQSSPPNAR